MKIDKRMCPILFEKKIFLRKWGITNWVRSNNPMLDKDDESVNRLLLPCFNNINYITQPILKAFDFAPLPTIEKLISLRNEINSIHRTVIWKSEHTTQTTLYTFFKEDHRTLFTMFHQMTSKTFLQPLSVVLNGFYNHDGEKDAYMIGGGFSHQITGKQADKWLADWVELIVQCEVFLQYAELEVKHLKQNEKDSIICRYENKLPFPIDIIDSTWYTELIKSDAFKVRGHFRLQPFGEGLSKRKLIWINEFQKEGYHRLAKKEFV